MKKIISLILVFTLLTASAAASAEGARFTLRSGITWGMSPDEVRAIEGQHGRVQEKENGLSLLGYMDVKVSKYSANFGAIFANDKLFFCMYELEDDSQTKAYLLNALASKYGESTRVDASVIDCYMNNIESDDYLPDLSDGQQWISEDTTIWIFTLNNQLMIFYYLTDFDWSEIGLFDTFGL